jgi:hypothetical protein
MLRLRADSMFIVFQARIVTPDLEIFLAPGRRGLDRDPLVSSPGMPNAQHVLE